MPIKGIVLPVDTQHFGFLERLYVSLHLPRITDLQNAGLRAEEIAVQLNRWGSFAINGHAWSAERVFVVP